MRPNLGIRAFVVAVVAIVPFARCLPDPWLWDDRTVLEQRLAPEKCGGIGDVWRQPYWGLDTGPPDTYRPLSLSLIYLEKQAFGTTVEPYHIVSLGLHALVSLLVMAVFGRLAGPSVGWMSALLFASHPVHAEAVGMIYGQLELVSAAFVLLTVWFYVQARSDGVRPIPFALAIVCALCASGSKESAVMLPGLLLLVRACWMVGDSAEEWRSRFVRGLGWDFLFVLAMVPYLVLRFRVLGSLTPDSSATVMMGFGIGQRIKTVVISLGHALRLCLFPTGQGLYYGHLRDSVVGLPFQEIVWVVIGAIGFRWLAEEMGRRRVLFGLGWFLLAFFPVSNVIPTGVLVAERTLYLPSMGICFVAAAMIDWLGTEKKVSPGILRGVVAGLVVIGGVASSLVVAPWRSDETLWRATVEAHPKSPLGHFNMGKAILNRLETSKKTPDLRELAEADAEFETAEKLNPKLASEALVGRGALAARGGDRAKAERLIREAMQADPNSPAPKQALRSLLEKSGRPTEP